MATLEQLDKIDQARLAVIIKKVNDKKSLSASDSKFLEDQRAKAGAGERVEEEEDSGGGIQVENEVIQEAYGIGKSFLNSVQKRKGFPGWMSPFETHAFILNSTSRIPAKLREPGEVAKRLQVATKEALDLVGAPGKPGERGYNELRCELLEIKIATAQLDFDIAKSRVLPIADTVELFSHLMGTYTRAMESLVKILGPRLVGKNQREMQEIFDEALREERQRMSEANWKSLLVTRGGKADER